MSKATTKAVALTALGFAHLVAWSFQYVFPSPHLPPLTRGTCGSVLPEEQAAANGERRAARATREVIFQLTSGSGGSDGPSQALTAPAT